MRMKQIVLFPYIEFLFVRFLSRHIRICLKILYFHGGNRWAELL